MRPKYSTSLKIIEQIIYDFDKYNHLITKIRLRKNYKHLKYLWKYYYRLEGKYFQLRLSSYVDSADIEYMTIKWEGSYTIQKMMTYAGIWKWMIIYKK